MKEWDSIPLIEKSADEELYAVDPEFARELGYEPPIEIKIDPAIPGSDIYYPGKMFFLKDIIDDPADAMREVQLRQENLRKQLEAQAVMNEIFFKQKSKDD